MPRKFVKLGPVAASFADVYSEFKIHRGQVKELVTQEQRRSKKIANAIRGGHLNTATEAEFEDYMDSIGATIEKPELTHTEKLEAMTKKELKGYYEDNFEVDEDEIAAFGKLKQKEMVDEILELEKDPD